MDRWLVPLKQLTREEIFLAVDDRDWQTFRLKLKGLPTSIKLDKLYQYLYNTPSVSSGSEKEDQDSFENRIIRVANYLNALRRGGQLNHNNEVVR